ncbi:MAG: hypothetical protein WD492_05935 [Alkalispirochaeta sp.]
MTALQTARYVESDLHENHPPKLRSEHKRVVYEAALATRPPSDIAIKALRWAPAGVPQTFASDGSGDLTFEVVPGVFAGGAHYRRVFYRCRGH